MIGDGSSWGGRIADCHLPIAHCRLDEGTVRAETSVRSGEFHPGRGRESIQAEKSRLDAMSSRRLLSIPNLRSNQAFRRLRRAMRPTPPSARRPKLIGSGTTATAVIVYPGKRRLLLLKSQPINLSV